LGARISQNTNNGEKNSHQPLGQTTRTNIVSEKVQVTIETTIQVSVWYYYPLVAFKYKFWPGEQAINSRLIANEINKQKNKFLN